MTIPESIPLATWQNWRWQQQQAVRNIPQLQKYFPGVPAEFWNGTFTPAASRLKFQVTPYLLSQIPQTITAAELHQNPFFLQFFPQGKLYQQGPDAYDGTDNWENAAEFPTSNLQHKYTNRALIRFRDCFGYCNFCFEALGTLEQEPATNKLFAWSDWKKSLEYLESTPGIEEVVLSGGEPLLNADAKLERILRDISEIQDAQGNPKIRFKRIHTRVMTFNPYRVTEDLVKIFSQYHITEIAFNVAHPAEITSDFQEAVGRIKEAGRDAPLLAMHTPLLRKVNDCSDTLWDLWSKAYDLGIKPYYLLHTMPHTPFADQQRISVREGVRLMRTLKRHKSNIALPEYVVVHYDGKQTVPLELAGTPEFQYTHDAQGNPIVHFLNWKGNWVDYPDSGDGIS